MTFLDARWCILFLGKMVAVTATVIALGAVWPWLTGRGDDL